MRLVIRVVVLITTGIAVAVAWRWLRGAPAPVFSDDSWPADEPWPSLDQQTGADGSVAEPSRTSAAEAPSEPSTQASESSNAWVKPDDTGACPLSHPVKAKVGSGIYHVPGAFNYERTHADRCYVDGAAAEADGMRKAKR